MFFIFATFSLTATVALFASILSPSRLLQLCYRPYFPFPFQVITSVLSSLLFLHHPVNGCQRPVIVSCFHPFIFHIFLFQDRTVAVIVHIFLLQTRTEAIIVHKSLPGQANGYCRPVSVHAYTTGQGMVVVVLLVSICTLQDREWLLSFC